MATKTYSIPSIHCNHCVMAIRKGLMMVSGVDSVEGDPAEKTIEVEYSLPADDAQIREKLIEIGYPAIVEIRKA